MPRAFVVFVVTFAYVITVGTPLLLYSAVTGDTDPILKAGLRGVRLALWLSRVTIEVRGERDPCPGRAVVYMPNHQSNIDPLVVFSVLPSVHILAKQVLFKVPVLGRAMRLRGFIPVDRSNRDRAIQAMKEGVKSLRAGSSFLAYPEGTRSPDGRLNSFKKGVFIMAIEAGAPIVPVSISGSQEIMPKGSLAIRPGRVVVTLHEPVLTWGYTIDDLTELQAQVRTAILQGLTPEERPLGEL